MIDNRRFGLELLSRQIGGNSVIIILDTIYFISGAFFGQIGLVALLQYVLFMNMFVTCILYQNLNVTKGDLKLELITEKLVYYPTTRVRILADRYRKTLILLGVQSILTLLCLGVGYYGSSGRVDGIRVLSVMLIMFTGILIASGCCILVMHTMPLGVYLSMLAYLPLFFGIERLARILSGKEQLFCGLPLFVMSFILSVILLWLLLLHAGVKAYRRSC